MPDIISNALCVFMGPTLITIWGNSAMRKLNTQELMKLRSKPMNVLSESTLFNTMPYCLSHLASFKNIFWGIWLLIIKGNDNNVKVVGCVKTWQQGFVFSRAFSEKLGLWEEAQWWAVWGEYILQPAPLCTSCVTLRKALKLSELYFLYL